MSPETPGLQIQTVVRLYWTTSEQIQGLVSGIPADFCGAIYVITNLPRREREREPGKITFSESYYLLLFPRFTIDDCFYLCLLSLEWLR